MDYPNDIHGKRLENGLYFRMQEVLGTDMPSIVRLTRKGSVLLIGHVLGEVESRQYDETTRFYPISEADIAKLPERISKSQLVQTANE